MHAHKPPFPVAMFFLVFYSFGLMNGLYRDAALDYAPWLYWGLDALHFVMVPLCFVLLLGRTGWRAQDFGIDARASSVDWFDYSIAGVFLFMVLFAVYSTSTELGQELFGHAHTRGSFAAAAPTEQPLRAMVAIYAACTAGVMEELVYKGLLTPVLVRFKDSPAKVLLLTLFSAAAFGVIHWENGVAEVFGTGCVGLVSFLLYVRFGSLVPFMLAHTAIDLVHFW